MLEPSTRAGRLAARLLAGPLSNRPGPPRPGPTRELGCPATSPGPSTPTTTSSPTLALGWDHGLKPYRDLRGNNFPGTIYLFYGPRPGLRLGRTVPLRAFDAALVILFALSLLTWSRRRLGALLPGLIGVSAFLAYYLGLDYAQAAQRDFHGPDLALLALLWLDAGRGRPRPDRSPP